MYERSPRVAALTVGTSEVLLAVGAATRPGRRRLRVYNLGAAVIYVGPTGVTTGTGYPVEVGDGVTWDSPDDLYAISAAAGNDVRVMESI